MKSFNRTTVVGFLGGDPVLQKLASGTSVCRFSVATNERRRNGSGEIEESTIWFHVSVFGARAEAAVQYLRKGRYVYAEGSLHPREWSDQNGHPRLSLDVRASDVFFLDAAPKDSASSAPDGISDDDIPF